MFTHISRLLFALVAPFAIVTTLPLAQTPVPNAQQSPTHANILRGEYGRYRANNDLLFYHLDVRVDPQKKFISGKNTIRFRMLSDDNRIQLDLYDNLNVDKIEQIVNWEGPRARHYPRRLSASGNPAFHKGPVRRRGAG